MKKVELRITCPNKTGHCIKRYFWSKSSEAFDIECDIRDELEKYQAIYEYLRIQEGNGYLIATAYNG